MGKTEAVRVVVRCRPLNSKEKAANYPVVVSMATDRGGVSIKNPKAGPDEPPKTFTFDAVFDWNCTQTMVFEDTAQPIVDSVLEGYNGTIFAYGQTGTGKTFTMEGAPNPPELRGVIPRSFEHIFDTIDASENKQHLVRASYLEIYNEQVRDLLGNDPHKKLELKENSEKGVFVKDLTSYVVKNKNEIADVMAKGHKNRSVGATEMNATSSRSHSIFTIIIEISEEMGGESHIRQGKLNLVDLAGSERANKTGAQGDRLKEGCNINLSLSALGNVISALVDGKSKHVPYRDSKLTRLLQDSLGGNARTVMVANMGPADYNYDESLSTLRYANRAKNIKNKPKINEDPKDAMLREFQEEIQRLREQLASAAGGGPIDPALLAGMAAGGGGGGTRTITVADEALIQELQQKSEEEKKALLEQQNLAEEQKKAIEEELQKREEALAQEQANHEALQKKLSALEQNLVVGGVHVVDKVKQQEKELKKAEREMLRKKAEQEQLQKEKQEQEELRMLAEENYNSVQQEVEIKTKRLKQLNHKYQAAKAEVRDLTEEFEREREDLLDTVRELTSELKLHQVIMDNFMPETEVEKIRRRAVWDEELDDWRVQHIKKAGSNVRRPKLSNARESSAAQRREREFRQNVGVGMYMPERTTYDERGEPGEIMYARADAQGEILKIPTMVDNMYLTYDGGMVDPEAQPAKRSSSDKPPSRSKDREGKSRRPSSSSRKQRSTSASNSRERRHRHLDDSDRPRSGSSSRDPYATMDGGADTQPEDPYPKARGLVSRG